MSPARRVLALLLLTVAASAAAAVPAMARPVVGIGDANAPMFSDPNFTALGVRTARIVVPYDALERGGWERDQVDTWMAAASAHGVEPLVAFNHSRHAGPGPTVPQYRRAIQGFHQRYPHVRLITPWNEANYKSQPTAANPRLAAEYYNQTLSVFPGARIVAADVLDSAGVMEWLRTFRTYVYRRPQLWGVHNYLDTNHLVPASTSTTSKILRYLPGEVWLTETGGIVSSGSFPYDEARAARATQHMFDLAGMSPRITRLYIYNWYGIRNPKMWDSGLVSADGVPRPALDVVRRYLGR
jgi:hypothetical protein